MHQISATNAFALIIDPETMTSLTVYNIDFSGRTYTTKSATVFSFEMDNFSARFLADDSGDFYFAATGKVAGMSYKEDQAFVGSSLDSRRSNALLPSSWSGATSFSAADGSEVSHLDLDSLDQIEKVSYELTVSDNVDSFGNFVQSGYESLDVDASKVVKLNMLPTLITSLSNPTVKTTFGRRVEVGISIYEDLEGDTWRFEVSNDKHYHLNFYPVAFGTVDGVDVWKLRSDVLTENENAEIGTSTVTVTWVDITTRA